MDTIDPLIAHKHILLYDGECGFCNKSVEFVLKKEDDRQIYFAALQSYTGQKILMQHGYSPDFVESILYLERDKLYEASDAALRIAKHLKRPYRWLTIFKVLPGSILRSVYKLVARHRYKILGRKSACYIPPLEDRVRFLE